MNYAIGSLNLFHDLLEIHEFLCSLPVIYLYQFQGMIITVNSVPILRIVIFHDILGRSELTYSRIRVEM